MKGNVYTRQKCWSCGGRLVYDERRNGCFCKTHPKIQATGEFYVKFGRDINKRFPTYERSIRFLTGLRYEVDREKFDPRDYQASNPLGFENLATGYLDWKKRDYLVSFFHIERYMNTATAYFGDRNVKTIRKKDIGKYLYGIPNISEKTRSNYASALHDFWYNYLYEEEEILTLADLPKIPNIPYELGFRKIATIEDREKIVDRIKERTYHKNEKVWLAIDVLCSYNSLRPGDLLRLKEGDIDLGYGVLTFWRPTKSKKRKEPKVIRIRLLDYHRDEFRKLKAKYTATDSMPFFRHVNLSGVATNRPFAPGYLYKQWKKACTDMGIEDLDLYGGTRHSSITAMAKEVGKKQARKFSGHDTNKAFDRYCQITDDDTFNMAQLMAKMRGKVVEFKKKAGKKE